MGQFPGEYIPTTMDWFSVCLTYAAHSQKPKPINFQMWDTANNEDCDRIRTLSYPGTQFFFLCFSLVNPVSLDNVTYTWIPELEYYRKHEIPDSYIILVGTKKDLRTDPLMLEKLATKQMRPVTTESGLACAQHIGAFAYVETSSYTGEGIGDLIDLIFRATANPNIKTIGPPPFPPHKPPCPLDRPLPTSPNIYPIRQNLGKQLGNPQFSDVVVKVEDKTFHLHKIILAAGSPYFHDFLVKHDEDGNLKEIVLPQEYTVARAESLFRLIYGPAIQQIPPDVSPIDQFRSKLRTFMLNGTYSDISVKTKSGNIIPGHKVIFQASCALFEAFLDSGNEFGTEKKIVVPLDRLSTDEFQIIQLFLYGQDFKIDETNALQILTLSNQCLVAELEKQAQDFIVANTKLFNPFEVCVISHKLSLKKLEGYCIWYLKANFEDLKDKDGWKKLPDGIKNEVEAGRWPGDAHIQAVARWQKKLDKASNPQVRPCMVQ